MACKQLVKGRPPAPLPPSPLRLTARGQSSVGVSASSPGSTSCLTVSIPTSYVPDGFGLAFDEGRSVAARGHETIAYNLLTQGVWTSHAATAPDAGSTLSLMTLTLMALGVVARRFQRAAG